MTQEEIEYLHKTGKMPDRYYYQQNGMSPEHNLWEQRKKVRESIRKRQEEKQQLLEKKKQEQALEKAIDKEVRKHLDKIFSDL